MILDLRFKIEVRWPDAVITTGGCAIINRKSLHFFRVDPFHQFSQLAADVLQLGLVILLAASGPDLLRARRFMIVEGMSVVVLLAGLRTAPPVARGLLLALLLAGNAWALRDLAVFLRQSHPVGFSVPGVASPEGVGLVDFAAVSWAQGLGTRAGAGERVVLLHSQWCPTESLTNPVGVLERLYLTLGHERFVRSVTALAVPCRYVCLPLPSEADFPAHIATLAPGQRIDLDETCREQMAHQLAALQERFRLTPVGGPSRFSQFVLRERGPSGQ